jgi:hypothetical protein
LRCEKTYRAKPETKAHQRQSSRMFSRLRVPVEPQRRRTDTNAPWFDMVKRGLHDSPRHGRGRVGEQAIQMALGQQIFRRLEESSRYAARHHSLGDKLLLHQCSSAGGSPNSDKSLRMKAGHPRAELGPFVGSVQLIDSELGLYPITEVEEPIIVHGVRIGLLIGQPGSELVMRNRTRARPSGRANPNPK